MSPEGVVRRVPEGQALAPGEIPITEQVYTTALGRSPAQNRRTYNDLTRGPGKNGADVKRLKRTGKLR